MGWDGHVACTLKINTYKILVAQPEGKTRLGTVGMHGRMVLK